MQKRAATCAEFLAGLGILRSLKQIKNEKQHGSNNCSGTEFRTQMEHSSLIRPRCTFKLTIKVIVEQMRMRI
ncbi:hypothetical protein ABPG72_008701 [Tetrahymena utriculariae]